MKSRTVFTKKDIIVALCSTIFLVMTLGSVGGVGRGHSKRIVCLANEKQLLQAWLAFAEIQMRETFFQIPFAFVKRFENQV